ncbi:MAG TPA: cobalt-precorrin-6A reductase [Roseiarcus sp.]|nr:cobalt-precorrin-6A reductase [Roseiarcus sp.]
MRVLILGGSSEASRLAARLAEEKGFAPILSLAGRTRDPSPPPIPYRIGGFGGAAGLAAYLSAERIDCLIDATHPFAERMSANAEEAAAATGTPLFVFTRPPWTPGPGDRWIECSSAGEAAQALGSASRRVFLTVGRLQLAAFEAAPQHDYLIRTIDPPHPAPALPRWRLILARGPFGVEAETQLMRAEGIEILATKNSGGEATRAKLDAARALGLDVILIRRPPAARATTVYTIDAAMAFLRAERHRASP